jgi:tetratricopeptide (TPR) repeat protein
LLAGAFAISLAVFAPSLNGGFIFDDLHLPFADPHAAKATPAFWIGGVRPILMLTYWINFLISGTDTLSYHLVNLFIHASNAVLIFFIYDRLFEISRAKVDRRWFALFGASLFLLHPLQTESVDYIAGRSELVSGFFFFSAWLVFLRHFEKESGFFLSLKIGLLAGLGVLAKESAISLPAVLLLTDLCFRDKPIGQQLKGRLKLYSLFLVGGLAAAIKILGSLTAGTAAGTSIGVSSFEYFLTQCRVILTYLRLFLIPVGQNGDWQLSFYRSLAGAGQVAFLLAILMLLGLAIWLYPRDRLASFGLAAFFVMLAPTSSIIPIKDALAERRMYLPMAGLLLLVLALAARIRFTPAWRAGTAIVILLVCAVLSSQRSTVWASDFNFWSDSARGNPANYRAHFGLGVAMMVRKDCPGAVHEFAAARAEAPSDQEVLWNLASAQECAKQFADALASYRSYASVNATSAAYNHIGYVEAMLGHPAEAQDVFERAIKLDPNDATAYAYRGMMHYAVGSFADARIDLRRALEIDPDNQIAATGMAKLAAQH